MVLYLVAALIVGLAGWMIWRKHGGGDRVEWRGMVTDAGLLALGVLFFSAARTMWVYPPLMILHLLASLLYGWAFLGRLAGRRVSGWLFTAPLATLALFVLAAWLFREV
ncbi:MAG: hypothetical protein GXO33_02610 [Epsilonproteobacteria bacterium]|nr:hypothetical protein [Campylobacterota bacterium]